MKVSFSFFLSIYSLCGAPASWVAQHTTGVFKSVVLCILAHALSSAKEMADSSEIR